MLAFITVRARSNNMHFLFVLFLTTFFLINLPTIRFGTLQGSDVLYEYKSARTTLEQGTWDLGRSDYESYFSSFSVSLVPAILSEMTGANLFLIFEVIMRLVAATLPLCIFVTVKASFKNTRIAALSSLLFAQNYFNFNTLPYLMRQFMAEIALVLVILLIVRLYSGKPSSLFATILLGMIFCVAAYHYTVAYFVMAILFFLLAFETWVNSIPQEILRLIRGTNLLHRRRILRVEYLAVFLVLLCSWTVLTNLIPVVNYIHNVTYLLTGGSQPAGISTGKYQTTSWLTGGAVGLVTTAWFLMGALLSGLGFLYFVFKVRKQTRHLPWAIGALLMFISVVIWINPSFSGGFIYLDRVYLVGSIFFTAFSAGFLLKVNRKLKVFLALFLLLNLPINMLLLDHSRYLLYNRESAVSPHLQLTQTIVLKPSFVFSEWLNTHQFNETIILADNPTGARSLYCLDFRFWVQPFPFDISSCNETQLVFLHYLNLDYGLWQTGEQDSVSFSIGEVLNQSSIAYNNGQAVLASYLP